MASVKVAVRVRPFNQREIDMDAKCILKMEGKKTRISNSSQKNAERHGEQHKFFTFDHSYWSFDHNDPHFISQEQVFEDLGTEVVDAAFEGYNACVFAYGQTGSGKTYTMMGEKGGKGDMGGGGKGLIPRICEALFGRMAHTANYRIEVSYLEIYNEKVKDLLRPGGPGAHNLKVRQHPTKGPCVMDLSTHLVSEYCHIQDLMERGNRERTTASTNMNDVSSRSHAIFTLCFVQAQGTGTPPSPDHLATPTETLSKVHLVDLAGSERADASGASGQRLKEGAHINKSLVTLGSVISALAELSSSSSTSSSAGNRFIPYRDSVLTWLLKDSLGGNSKTIMIAAVSPADCNYSETLSTLRYANRAKNIINKPTINEDQNVKLIRELRNEITKLKSMMSGNECPMDVLLPQVLATLQEKEAQESRLREEWNEKWRETHCILQEQKALGLRKAGGGRGGTAGVTLDSDKPHLIGIDDDLLSTGVTLYHLNDDAGAGVTVIGSGEGADIVLSGVDVERRHCSIRLEAGGVATATLEPHDSALCFVNGVQVTAPTPLSQGCSIQIGRTYLFRYNDPVEVIKLRKEGGSGSSQHSTLNLSRLSLMSCSTPDLSPTTPPTNNNNTIGGEEQQLQLQLAAAGEQKRICELQANVDRKKEELALLEMKQTQLRRDSLSSDSNHVNEIDAVLLNRLRDSINCVEHELKQQNEALSVIVRSVGVGVSVSDNNRNNLNLSLAAAPLAASSPRIESSPAEDCLHSPMSDSPRNLNRVQRNLFYARNAVDLEADSLYQMKLLTQQISNQRRLIMKCLESEIDAPELNRHIGVLQELKRDYVRLELQELQEGSSCKENSGRGGESVLSCCGDSDELSTSADDTISESMVDESSIASGSRSTFQSRDCLNCAVLNRSSRDIRYRILQDRLQMSLAPPSFSVSIQDVNQLTASNNNYSMTRSMPSLNRISVWGSRVGGDWGGVGEGDQRLRVCVPHYLLRGAGRNTHYVYEVVVCVEGEMYSLLRRYRRFRELHLTMKHKYGDAVSKLSFPPRKLFLWQMDGELLAKERRPLLEAYLRRLLACCATIDSCPLYCPPSASANCTKAALHQFSPFFRKGAFESGKHGTG